LRYSSLVRNSCWLVVPKHCVLIITGWYAMVGASLGIVVAGLIGFRFWAGVHRAQLRVGRFQLRDVLLPLLLCVGFASQTYTVLNVESVDCSGNNMEYKQTLVSLAVGTGECAEFNMALQNDTFSTYQIAFPAATDDTLSWLLFETGCGPAALASGNVDIGECTPIVAQSGKLQGSSIIALRDASLHIGLVIRGFTDSQCLGTHGEIVEGNIIGECVWFTSPLLGQVQVFGYSMETNVVYFGVGCGKGPSNMGSAKFVVAAPGQCVNSGTGAYYRADVSMPSTTTLPLTSASELTSTTTSSTATTNLSEQTSTATIAIDTTTTTNPLSSTLTSSSPTLVPTSAPTEPSTSSSPASLSSATSTSQLTTIATTMTSIVTTAPVNHTSPPSSSWNQLSEIARICVVVGILIGFVLLCFGIGCIMCKLRRPKETLFAYEPSGDKYALLQAMQTEEDDLDSEELLSGHHAHFQEISK
jgi:hypothetical protein